MKHKIYKLVKKGNKLYGDMWDYDVLDCIEKGNNARIILTDETTGEMKEYIDVTPEKLRRPTIIDSRTHPSNFNKPYVLWSYLWKNPQKVEPIKSIVIDEEFVQR